MEDLSFIISNQSRLKNRSHTKIQCILCSSVLRYHNLTTLFPHELPLRLSHVNIVLLEKCKCLINNDRITLVILGVKYFYKTFSALVLFLHDISGLIPYYFRLVEFKFVQSLACVSVFRLNCLDPRKNQRKSTSL